MKQLNPTPIALPGLWRERGGLDGLVRLEILGAIGGCVVGRHLAKEKAAQKKADAQNHPAPAQ